MERRSCLIGLGALALGASQPGSSLAQANRAPIAHDGLRVLCSFSILQDLVSQVGGARVRVQTLVAAGADAHTFEPRPAHLKALLASQLLVINGLNFEPWAEKMVKAASYSGQVLVASSGLKPRNMAEEVPDAARPPAAPDPHAWQDPNNVAHYVQAIAHALVRLDPAGSAAYQAQAQAYLAELHQLDAWIQAQLATLQAHQRQVITSHDAFGYFAARYQIRFLAPLGLSTESSPSARGVARLIAQIRRERIRALFLENMSDPKLIAQIASETGVRPGPALYVDALGKPGEAGDTYLGMMRHNVGALMQGMRAN